ncbi:hypothetical protein L327_0121285 [Yersinia pestis S3]|nr:hypothetical protein L327_0121285 [Yersinia pestis S3]
MTEVLTGYNLGYLDEQTKCTLRRAILKAVAIPGYQVPFGGREMPMPYGWGTGGIQLTACLIGHTDVLKVIDQAQMTPPMPSRSAAFSNGSAGWQPQKKPLKPH